MYTKAFEGDHYLITTYLEIVEKFKPTLLIETGTQFGNSTQFFASLNIPLIAIEKNQEYHDATLRAVGNNNNLTLLLGDSPTVLEEKFEYLKDKKILAFLDAHWGGGMILQRELKLMAKLPTNPYLIIHDFYNPEHPEYGYDTHDTIPYKFESYSSLFEDIYGKNLKYKYNQNAAGAKQGAIFLYADEQ